MQVTFQEGRLPEDMTYTTMVLLLNGGGYFRDIRLVEMIWNVLTSIMNNCFRSAIMQNDSLHGFRQGRETRTSTLEENLAQQLVGICHKHLLQVFLDVRKAYDLLYHTRCIYWFQTTLYTRVLVSQHGLRFEPDILMTISVHSLAPG